ncbi:hypothetical protein [Roseateles chitosanitabidus]|uniref:hypothetical protein n=1 Tax=Roseateles chitosanitabidus TaxID=65048 RepID=UPI000A02A4BA|nr:hypothetical protein [Roseateles chitosanitabidus]
MSKIPGVKKLVKFTKEVRGSFGRFKTDHSHQIYFLSTSVPVNQVGELSTAGEIFSSEKIKFEELIQRDIDYRRVQKIANDYLSKGAGRVIFFPPLLACVVLVEDDGSLRKQYSTVESKRIENADFGSLLQTTWDGDGFQLDLPEADPDSSERSIDWDGGPKHFHEFAATLRLNPKRAKLVVLDGQHRLEAIRLLQKNSEQQQIIAGLEIPICVIWAPEASLAAGNDENMAHDFRELFVRVNSEPRKVSGHFITLLKDDSYSAMSLRQLADRWKADDEPGKWSRLHLLEWNTREDERVDVRTRDFSVTTVSIVAKVLEEHLFSAGAASELLNLDQSATKFEQIDPEFSWDGIVDATQMSAVDAIVKEHIETYLVSALDTLFRKAPPYAKLEAALGDAFARLQAKVAENNSSFIGLKALLKSYIYREEEMFEASARAAFVDFKSWIKTDPNDRIYFFSVFQQALIRFWIRLAAILKPHGVSADASAVIAIAALEKLVFVEKARYLSAERRYTRRTLWRNENVNFTSSWAKTAWSDLVGASLLHKDVRAEILRLLELNHGVDADDSADVDAKLSQAGYALVGRYSAKLNDELVKETRQALQDFFGEEKAAQLRALNSSGKDSDKKEFEAQIKKKAEARHEEALKELADQLKMKTTDLLLTADAS